MRNTEALAKTAEISRMYNEDKWVRYFDIHEGILEASRIEETAKQAYVKNMA